MTASPQLLGAFVWPSLFAGGAAAVGVPILIHLLARRRFRRIRWAAIEFLLQAERRNRRRIRMEDLILLLMRCAAVVLIALLVARPFVRPEGLAALLGGATRTERVIVLDDSFSMGYRSGGGGSRESGTSDGGGATSFERARQSAVQLIKLLREQSPGDTVTLLRTSDVESPVATGVFLNERQTDGLIETVGGLQLSQQAMSPRDVFVAIGGLMEEQSDSVNVTLYVISDFQRKDWVDGGSAGEGTKGGRGSVIAPLTDWGDESTSLNLVLVDVGDDGARNLAVARIEVERNPFVAGVSSSITVTVANYSNEVAGVDLEVSVGPTVQPTVSVPQIQPYDSTRATSMVMVVRPGWERVRVAAEPDGLPLDDERSVVIEATDATGVLIVNGEPSTDSYRDEVALLRTAIRPPGEVFSGNEPTVIDEIELQEIDLKPYGVVLLANVYRVTEQAATTLGRFVRDGGGVAVFLGDQVDTAHYNQVMYADGEGFLPARLDEIRSAPVGGVRLVADDVLHPVVRVFGGDDNPFAAKVTFDQYVLCTPHGWEEGTEAPGESVVDRSRVIAHFSDAERSAAIVERTFGRGRVLLVTSTCDQEWNDWGKDPSYVVSMLEMARYLGQGASSQDELVVGVPIEIPLDPGRFNTDAVLRTPAFPAESEIAISAVADEQGQGMRLVWDQVKTAGVYQFVTMALTGEEVIRAVAVNLDSSESDLTAATEADLRQAMPELPFVYVAGLASLDAAGEEARRELWRGVLLAAMAVLMGEQLLGWWFGRRMS